MRNNRNISQERFSRFVQSLSDHVKPKYEAKYDLKWLNSVNYSQINIFGTILLIFITFKTIKLKNVMFGKNPLRSASGAHQLS